MSQLGLKKAAAHEPPPTAPGSVATPISDPYAGITPIVAADDDFVELDTAVTSAPPVAIRPHESIIAALEAASRGASGNDYAVVYRIMVAAGNLKQATGAAIGKVGGELGGMIEMLHNLL